MARKQEQVDVMFHDDHEEAKRLKASGWQSKSEKTGTCWRDPVLHEYVSETEAIKRMDQRAEVLRKG